MNTLIFMRESDLKPSGGPAGFCYSIMQEVKKQKIDRIEFLPNINEEQAKQVALYRKVTSKLPKWINAAQIAYRRKKDYERMIKSPVKHDVDLDKYGAVHFHSTISLYKFRKDLETYSGKVILTTHCPVPAHQEVFAELPTKFEKKFYRKFYSSLDQIDEFSFQRADYIIYPCEDAEESYFKNWEKYASLHDKLKEQGKLIYIPTGIEPKKVIKNRKQICEELGLQQDEIIVSYAGRHNEVKGYDLLQKIAQNLWNQGKNYQFIICGNQAPLKGLDDARWHEIGWTNDSQSYVSASDVFVLPNRETYFDIVMLEVISCGKIVIASRTGGNKYFERIGADGILLYDTLNEAADLVKRIAEMSKEQRLNLEESNRRIFRKYFTTDKYVSKYLSFLDSI